MKKLIYIVFFITAVCQGQIIIDSYNPFPSSGIDGLYNWSDAATPSPNEANAIELSTTDGWDAFQNVTVGVSSSEFFDGSYSIQIEALVGGSDYARLYFTAEIGSTYRITYRAKTNVAGDGFGRMRGGLGFVTNPAQQTFDTTWTEYTADAEASATTAAFQFYATFPGGAIGDQTFVDNITIIKL